MLELLLPGALALHGLIHLIGFSKEWNLVPLTRVTGKTLFDVSGAAAKVVGIAWLLGCMLLLAAAVACVAERPWYWLPAAAGIILSQSLIVIYWHDASWGTLVNAILLVAIVFHASRRNFDIKVHREIQALTTAAGMPDSAGAQRAKALPLPVQRWLIASGAHLPCAVATLRQTGMLKTKKTGRWMHFTATQHCAVSPPAFVWNARMQTSSFITIAARDKYANGKGNMLIKPFYLFPLADVSGSETDQGTLVRFLAEMVWYPQAALQPYVQWNAVDDTTATATITYQGITARGTFTVDGNGRVRSFDAERYGNFNDGYRKEHWHVAMNAWRQFNGRTVPTHCEITWKLKEGDFTWLTLDVTDVRYE